MVHQYHMVFRRRSRLGQVIDSYKHIIDTSGGLSSTASVISLATGIDTVTDPKTQVPTGAIVSGIFISFYIIGSSGAPRTGPIDWYIGKLRTGQNGTTDFPDPGQTGGSGVRNQILHEEKGLSGSGDGTPMVFKGVIAIPRSMRRMRDGDVIFIKAIGTGTDNPNFCVKAIYKHFK